MAAVLVAAAGTAADAGERSGDRDYPVLPIAFYTQETSLGLGAMAVTSHRWDGSPPEARPNSLRAVAFYTLKHQYNVALSPEVYLSGGRHNLSLDASFRKWPDTFWGVGRAAAEENPGEAFSRRVLSARLAARTAVRAAFYVGYLLDAETSSISDTEDGGLLSSGTVPGADGGSVVGAGALVDLDDRDRIFWPGAGRYFRISGIWYAQTLGSAHAFSRIVADLRGFVTPWQDHVIALQALGEFTGGQPPFYRLPQLGGESNMRGLYRGRFRDRQAVSAQVEYRWPFAQRLAAVAFVGAGEVAPELSAFDLGSLLWTGGVGFRFALDREDRMNLRLDVGISRYGVAPSIVVMEAF